MTTVLLIIMLFNQWISAHSLNILAILPHSGRSHFFVFEKYLQALAEKGHNLTVISHFPRARPLQNYHDVSIAQESSHLEGYVPMETSYGTIIRFSCLLREEGNRNCKAMLGNEMVQKIWQSEMKFDLVVMETFYTECGLGLAYKLGAPVIGITAAELMPWQYHTFGIPFNPSYVPSITTGGLHPTLYERLEKTAFHFIHLINYEYTRREDQKILKEYLGDLPPLDELSKNVKMLLLYQNFVLAGSRLLPPNVIEVGGYHVLPPKPLPQDLQKFIDDSDHGVIYISFGSMLRVSSLPPHKMNAILATLRALPQRVIWKWDEDTFPGDAKDIYLSKWLPQNEILAHPKVLAFYSHGGLLSTTEAVYRSVPLVIMPVFGDQAVNAAVAEAAGFGGQISLAALTKENLLEKFRTVLNLDFRKQVKLLSQAYRDRPTTPIASAVFWTEYAAKYHNITPRNPAVDIPLYQYVCLDVIAVVVSVVVVIFAVVVKLSLVLMSVMTGYIKFKRE